MNKSNGQLIIIADRLHNQQFKEQCNLSRVCWFIDMIKEKNILYTSLLPGPEMEAAEVALDLKVPYIAVIPFKDWYKKWPKKVKNQYKFLLKKAIKIVYVDRQNGYISDIIPPDKHSEDKTRNQIAWLLEKIKIYPGTTQIITYVSGLYSPKNVFLQRMLEREEFKDKWHLNQKIHMEIIIPEDDDLPF